MRKFSTPPNLMSEGMNDMNRAYDSDKIQTIVIGGGQAGLSVGYYLAKRGLPFQILDANPRIGDAWRNRWDSLRLFNPARYAGLPGMRFPARGDSFPTKDQVADYLADYAWRFHLPVRNGVRVDRLWKEGDRFVIAAGRQRFESENVVVAMANYQAAAQAAFRPGSGSGDRPVALSRVSQPLATAGRRSPGRWQWATPARRSRSKPRRSHPTWISGKEIGAHPVADRQLPRQVLPGRAWCASSATTSSR